MARIKQRRARGQGSLGRRSNGVYRPYFTRPGGARDYLGVFYTHEDADKALKVAIALRSGATVTPGQRKHRTLEVVLREAVAARLQQKRISSVTAKRDLRQLEVYLAPEAAKPIDEFEAADIRSIYERLTSTISERTHRPLGAATVRNARAALKLAFEYALERRWVDDDVTERSRFSIVSSEHLDVEDDENDSRAKTRFRRFTADENSAFLKAIESDRLYARWLLQFRYGLRPAEVLGIVDEAWDAETRVLNISRALAVVDGELRIVPLKTRQSKRRLELDAETADAIDEWIAARDRGRGGARRTQVGKNRPKFLFTQESDGVELKPLTPQADTTEWARLMRRSGIQNATRYTLRHNALSFLVEHFPIPVVARIAGHKDVNMIIAHYLHAADDVVASVGDIFSKQPAP